MLEQSTFCLNKGCRYLSIAIILCFTLLVLPIQQIRKVLAYNQQYDRLAHILRQGPTEQVSEINIEYLHTLLSRKMYVGAWQSSIKRSQFLEEQSGRIQMRTIKNYTESSISQDIRIKIIDGKYKDNKFYDISINSLSMKVHQRFQPNKVLYETVSPLIAFFRKGYGMKMENEKALYINKMKIKVIAVMDNLTQKHKHFTIEFLISSQYSINIICRNLQEYPEMFYDAILVLILMMQICLQGYGIYHISLSIVTREECSSRYSKMGFLLLIANDVMEGTFLGFLGTVSSEKLTVFSLPIATIWILIIAFELRILAVLFHEQLNQSSLKFSVKVYSFFAFYSVVCYLINFNKVFFTFSCLTSMFPQIYQNYKVGHKLKQNMKYFLYYVLPRYAFLVNILLSQPYFLMTESNFYGFQPDWSFCIFLIFLILVQVGLIFAQVTYGVRSIMPKFLHPQQLKYFLSESDSEDDTCSICLSSLKQKSAIGTQVELSQFKEIRGQEMFNSVVLTPCRHKFHIECLKISMETKLQCPNCRAILPPLQEYD